MSDMAIKTLQFIEVDSDPIHSITQNLQQEYKDVCVLNRALGYALTEVIHAPEEAACDNCKGVVGYYLEEADDGHLEHAYWHYTALILHGPEYPVIRLCEDCAAPVIQPSHAWVSDQRGLLSAPGMTSLIISDPTEGA